MRKDETTAIADWTRRHVLASAAGAASLALAGGLSAPAVAQTAKLGGKLTYWGGLIFSDAANKMLTDTINAWG